MRRRRVSGSITVFFSLILFLLVSLVLVSVESARQQSAASILQMNTSVAMASLGGRYYAPLFDKYSIYGLYGEDMEGSLRELLAASANPTAHLPEGYTGDRRSGYSFTLDQIDVSIGKKISLLDAEGELLRRQMVSAGAVYGVEHLLQELLEALGILKQEEKGLQLLEEKAALEEKTTAMEQLILRLMPVLDGVPTNATGILCDGEGRITPESSFVKKMTLSEPTRESVGIDSFSVYVYLQPAYRNLTDMLALVTEAYREAAADSDSLIAAAAVNAQLNTLLSLLMATSGKTQEAIKLVDKLRAVQDEIPALLSRYEAMLSEAGDVLSEEWKASLSESIQRMRQYLGNGKGQYDFNQMYQRLSANYTMLLEARKHIMQCLYGGEEVDWEAELRLCEEALSDYSVKELVMHYAGMKRGTDVKNTFFQAVKNLLVEGLTSGIIEAEGLSTRSIRTGLTLPSQTLYLGAADVFSIELPDAATDVGESTLWKLIRGMKLSKISELLCADLEQMIEKLMLVSYGTSVFSSHADSGEEDVLLYQVEYLLYGKRSDADNYRRAALSILGVRLALNLAHTFTDPEKKAMALVTSAEIFGSTLPFLTSAGQYLILLAWGLQNAKLETVEILKGKKVPFLVTKETFQVRYDEVVTMGKQTRFERAEAYKGASGPAPTYNTYLLMFLLFSKEEAIVYHAADLMQAHICTYEDAGFRMTACYGGVTASVQARLQPKYVNIPMVGTGAVNPRIIEASGTILY